jgi:hypothetical protein
MSMSIRQFLRLFILIIYEFAVYCLIRFIDNDDNVIHQTLIREPIYQNPIYNGNEWITRKI